MSLKKTAENKFCVTSFQVQVMSQSQSQRSKRRPIAVKRVIVADDRVELDYLMVDVVSGVRLDLVTEKEMPGSLVAKVITHSQLTERYQVN